MLTSLNHQPFPLPTFTKPSQRSLPQPSIVDLITNPSSFLLEKSPDEMRILINSCKTSLREGNKPQLIEDGLGGTYFLQDSNRKTLAVFKPWDEDPSSPNNPKRRKITENSDNSDTEDDRFVVEQSRRGIESGIAVFRECAAYFIDQLSGGFVGVPPTTLVAIRGGNSESNNVSYPRFPFDYINWNSPINSPMTNRNQPLYGDPELSTNSSQSDTKELSVSRLRIGSLQKWIEHDCQSWDVGFSMFQISQVHRIGIFDIRVLNTDRHAGNLLVKQSKNSWGEVKFDLIPIDHSFILPSTLNEAYFEWLHWPQAKVPFDQSIKDYVASLDWRSDIQFLKKMSAIDSIAGKKAFNEKHFLVFRIMTIFLKKTVAAGCRLFEIASLVCRDFDQQYSILEEFCIKSIRKIITDSSPSSDKCEIQFDDWSPTTTQEEAFFRKLELTIDEYLLQFFPPISPRE